MATGVHGKPRDGNRGSTPDTRADVVEILAGAVLELLVVRSHCPSPDEVQTRRKPLKTAISPEIRGSL